MKTTTTTTTRERERAKIKNNFDASDLTRREYNFPYRNLQTRSIHQQK